MLPAKMKLKLETNPRNPLDLNLQLPTGAVLMLTAPLISERWIFRVSLDKQVALLAVPEFGGVNIYVQRGKACTKPVPYEAESQQIIRTINNCAGPSAPAALYAAGIQLIKAAVNSWRCGTKLDDV